MVFLVPMRALTNLLVCYQRAQMEARLKEMEHTYQGEMTALEARMLQLRQSLGMEARDSSRHRTPVLNAWTIYRHHNRYKTSARAPT